MSLNLQEQNSYDNWRMAKCHTKPNKNNWAHKPNIRGFPIVTAEEVLEKLLEAGIKRDKRTLQRYAKQGLITPPNTQSLGRGKGRMTDYDEIVPNEINTIHQLMHGFGLDAKKIYASRKLALRAINSVDEYINTLLERNPEELLNLEITDLNYEVIKKAGEPISDEVIQKFGTDYFMGLLDLYYLDDKELQEIIPDPKEAKLMAFYWYGATHPRGGKDFIAEVDEYLKNKD